MASGADLSASTFKGSEEIFEFSCTPCFKDNKSVEAEKQCLDCNEYFCLKCLEFHNKLGATAGHKLLDKDNMMEQPGSTPTDRCHVHPSQLLTTFCADHDAVCCNTCIATNHKNCDSVLYTLKDSIGQKRRKGISKLKIDITTNIKKLQQTKTDFQKHLIVLDSHRQSDIKKVNDFAEGLIVRIKELENVDKDQIQSLYMEEHDMILAKIISLDDIIAAMEDSLKKLEQFQQNQDAQVLSDVKVGHSRMAEAKQSLHETGNTDRLHNVCKVNKDIEQYMASLGSLGRYIKENKITNRTKNKELGRNFKTGTTVYMAKLLGEYKVQKKTDKGTCDIFGSCFLQDGTLVLADWNNYNLARLCMSFKVTDQCKLPGRPWGVTCTGPHEVATTLINDKKVQFVSIGTSMTPTRSFNTADCCRGICFSNRELFVSCGGGCREGMGHVSVYSLTGSLLRKIQLDLSSKMALRYPRNIVASKDGSRIHVANGENFLTFDRNGQLLYSFSDPGLKDANGVCTLENGHYLVCGLESHSVIQVDNGGKKVGEVLRQKDRIEHPYSLCHDSANNRLVVTMWCTNQIKVFDMN